MSRAPRTTRFLLARHGQVDPRWRGRIYGDLDVDLAPAGEAQSRALAARLASVELAGVISSGLSRAEYGARLLREPRSLERRDEPDLRELGRGAWRGRDLAELQAEQPGAWQAWLDDPARLRPPEGESLEDLAARVLPCLERLAREFRGATVAIVAHSWVVRVATCHALGIAVGESRRFYVPTGGLVEISWPVGEPAQGPPVRPTLGGFSLGELPDPNLRWYRGPRT